jgi:rsbT antagonist protein RsbS
MQTTILKQGPFLIAMLQAALSDHDLLQFQNELSEKVGRFRSRGVVLDVTALDVIDSFATRTLCGIVETTKLRGAEVVIVGIAPDVAFAMVQMGLSLKGAETALDLDEGLDLLRPKVRGEHLT